MSISTPQLYASEWSPEYGVSDRLAGEQEEAGEAEVVEHAELELVDCPASRHPLAFVDGVRRIEAQLFYADDHGEPRPGIAGVFAVGAVVPEPSGRLQVDRVRVERWALFQGEQQAELPAQPGGWSWRSATVDDFGLDALVANLQGRMRGAESELAQELASEDFHVCLDGPLSKSASGRQVGYVKTHHRRLLAPADHARVADLQGGQRTSLFRCGERFSCYLRLLPRKQYQHTWYGVVRLEVPSVDTELVNQVAGSLQRFAGVPHVDPRAPQNLQAIGALEKELRRRCGDPGLSLRATRVAVRQFAARTASST